MGSIESGQRGSNHHNWKGGICHHIRGTLKKCPNHPRADRDGYVFEHILIAESALGVYLPMDSVVHHHNGNHHDNIKQNLVLCQDQGYHMLLHQRIRALKACGHAHWRKCTYCKEYDDPINLDGDHRHLSCVRIYQKIYRGKVRRIRKEVI
jgi:hypothetical protein